MSSVISIIKIYKLYELFVIYRLSHRVIYPLSAEQISPTINGDRIRFWTIQLSYSPGGYVSEVTLSSLTIRQYDGYADFEKHWPMDGQQHVRKMQEPWQQQPQQRRILASQLPPTNITLANLLLRSTTTPTTTASTPSTTSGNHADLSP